MQHALRLTLASDAQSLQFSCPPPSEQHAIAPSVHTAIAANTPTISVRILTSVWAVHILRQMSLVREPGVIRGHPERASNLTDLRNPVEGGISLECPPARPPPLLTTADSFSFRPSPSSPLAQMPLNRSLLSCGVAAISSAAVLGAPPSLTRLLKMVISGRGPDVHPPEVRQVEAALPRIPAKGPDPAKTRSHAPAEPPAAAASTSPIAPAVKREREERALARSALKDKGKENALPPGAIKQEAKVDLSPDPPPPLSHPDMSPAGPVAAPALHSATEDMQAG